MTIPNPGSDAALDAGCLCAVVDNHYGEGVPVDGPWGGNLWWVNGDCPLHAEIKPEVSR
jgi:hypothetical protein